jgi:hypothetical protein
MELYRELALLTDAQAERCLNNIVAAYSAQKGLKKVVAEKDAMQEAVSSAAAQMNVPLTGGVEIPAERKPEAIRVILVEMASIDELSQHITSWLETDRKTLLEPATTALILAGLVLILSTEVEIKYKQENGKRSMEVHIKKPSAPKKILEKIAGFF